MRTVKSIAKNGQVLNEIVEYSDLTAQELEMLVVPATESISDFKNFQVRRNKKGELLSVKAHDFSDEKSEEISQNIGKPNIVDLYTAFGESETPMPAKARKAARMKFRNNKLYQKAKNYVKNQK